MVHSAKQEILAPDAYALQCLKRFDAYVEYVGQEEKPSDIGRYEWLAVRRHLNDLEREKTDSDFHYEFDENKVYRFFKMCSFLKHVKGMKAGEQLQLEGWQCFIFSSMYSWVHVETGYRRFREVFVKVARKNGKTLMMSAPMLYGILFDGEIGAEAYCGATSEKQAVILFNTIRSMVKASAKLSKFVNVRKGELREAKGSGVISALTGDSQSLDGLNPSVAVIDEVHAHKTSDLYEVMNTGMVSRAQPLLISITTEGAVRDSLNDDLHSRSVQVLEGMTIDTYFTMLFTLDKNDDIFDEKVWRKANPNLGISTSVEALRDAASKAKASTASKTHFCMKNLNKISYAAVAHFNIDDWVKCLKDKITFEDVLACDKLYLGLDLSVSNDLTSLAVLGINYNEDKQYAYNVSFLPEDAVKAGVNLTQYRAYKEDGDLILTDGSTVDYATVSHFIQDINNRSNLVCIGYDVSNATKLMSELQDEHDIAVMPVSQGYLSMSPALCELTRIVGRGTLQHVPSRLMTWAMGNVTVDTNSYGSIKPNKSKSINKIDPAVALTIACAVYLELDEVNAIPVMSNKY